MRIALGVLGRESDVREQPPDALLGFRAASDAVHIERLGHRKPDREPRVERGIRILEYHLDLAAQRANVRRGKTRDVAAAELDAASFDVDQSQQRPSRGRLPASGFADQRQRLAGGEIEAHLLDRVHTSAYAAEKARAQVEPRRERANLEQWRRCG